MAMREGLARNIGRALRQVRPGLAALATSKLARHAPATLSVVSAAFADGAPIPVRYTQDGEGVFPALNWTGLPAGTQSLVLIVEDADAPFPRPIVHAILHSMPPGLSGLDEGAVQHRHVGPTAEGWLAGRNSLARSGWLAPSPIPAHGPHRYAFQLFALATTPKFRSPPGRTTLLRKIKRHVLARGTLIGTYERS